MCPVIKIFNSNTSRFSDFPDMSIRVVSFALTKPDGKIRISQCAVFHITESLDCVPLPCALAERFVRGAGLTTGKGYPGRATTYDGAESALRANAIGVRRLRAKIIGSSFRKGLPILNERSGRNGTHRRKQGVRKGSGAGDILIAQENTCKRRRYSQKIRTLKNDFRTVVLVRVQSRVEVTQYFSANLEATG